MKTQILVAATALVVIGATAYYQGRISDRWVPTTSEALETFTAHLPNVPSVIGDWEGVDEEIDTDQLEASNCTGCVSRVYQNQTTGQMVNVFLVSGTARHITIHTPDFCYVAAGYEMESQPNAYDVDVTGMPSPAEFRTTTFLKQDALGSSRLRILWGYSEDGHWTGPGYPKIAFAGRPALYKVYLITSLPPGGRPIEEDSAVAFARDCLPVINQVLFPTLAAVGGEAAPATSTES
jgi:hypothetical protein